MTRLQWKASNNTFYRIDLSLNNSQFALFYSMSRNNIPTDDEWYVIYLNKSVKDNIDELIDFVKGRPGTGDDYIHVLNVLSILNKTKADTLELLYYLFLRRITEDENFFSDFHNVENYEHVLAEILEFI